VAVTDADFAEIEKLFKEMEVEGAKILEKAGTIEKINFERSLDMRFVGQGAETSVPIPSGDFSQMVKEEVRRLFDQKYQGLYGRTYPESPAEFVSFRVRASLPERPLQLPMIEKKAASLKDAVKGQRPAYSAIARDFIPYTVYDRYHLFPGAEFDGPAIIEERESTTVVGEDASISVNEYGFLLIKFKGA
jgi:N-methylhydantoinase A